jgi:hypothetical protein
MSEVVWHLAGQLDEVERIVRRGARYVVLDSTDPDLESKDIQVGDILALWAGDEVGNGLGIAVKLLHCLFLNDRKDRPLWEVWACSEPHEARIADDEPAVIPGLDESGDVVNIRTASEYVRSRYSEAVEDSDGD